MYFIQWSCEKFLKSEWLLCLRVKRCKNIYLWKHCQVHRSYTVRIRYFEVILHSNVMLLLYLHNYSVFFSVKQMCFTLVIKWLLFLNSNSYHQNNTQTNNEGMLFPIYFRAVYIFFFWYFVLLKRIVYDGIEFWRHFYKFNMMVAVVIQND